MPTVLRINGFRFFFFSDEHLPLHIHVEKRGRLYESRTSSTSYY
ncbi:MAG: DUF4160 domain-containing protein [Campylobacterales bacterium]|nr:DUF4160 domain-containing protein [Campylobacterales bacterium]